jgi:hypothetical protein
MVAIPNLFLFPNSRRKFVIRKWLPRKSSHSDYLTFIDTAEPSL